jgi:hypothetical protein
MTDNKPFYLYKAESNTITILGEGFKSMEAATKHALESNQRKDGYGVVELIIEDDTYDIHQMSPFTVLNETMRDFLLSTIV